jgi:hypothetical protein
MLGIYIVSEYVFKLSNNVRCSVVDVRCLSVFNLTNEDKNG